jgi:hypothetical protein
MGHHYVPQYYLKGFTESNEDLLWAFEKGTGSKFNTQIKNMGNVTKFYSYEVEQYMANTIEGPANIVLDKIRKRHKINEDDKKIFAEYMAVMWKRVPRGRERLKEIAPSSAQKLSEELNRNLDILTSKEPTKAGLIERRRREIKEILDKYAEDPSKEIWLTNIPPERTPRFVAAIRGMKWTFLTFDEKPAFLTCDNPVFYFTGIGIGKPQSEITFPISNNITLWATWRDDLPQDYILTTTQTVREINRRTAHNASRYIFHCRDEYWIKPFVKKHSWQLHRLI